MTKYQDSKIYMVYSKDSPVLLPYYGSTTQTIKRRKSKHKSSYQSFLKGSYHYVTSFDIIKRGNWDIELMKNYPCNTKAELTLSEGYYIRNNPCVNIVIPGRTEKEYNDQYFEKNKDKINTEGRERTNCPYCSNEYSKGYLPKHKRTCPNKPPIT